MNLKQSWDTSELILKDFNDWKMPNIIQCFDRARAGRYGKTFDRVDCQVVMDWCSQYDLERMQDISEANEKKSGELKGLSKTGLSIQGTNKTTSDILLEYKTEYKKKNTLPVDKDSMQHFFNVKYELWERLVEKQNPNQSGFRFLKRYGKMLNGSDFVSYKLDQQKKVKQYLESRNDKNQPNNTNNIKVS